MIEVEFADPRSLAAAALIAALAAEIRARYPGDDGWSDFAPEQVLGPGGAFVIAWDGQRPVGCGALRPAEAGVGEIKRMFVASTYRGQRIGQRVLEKLEEAARAAGYRSLKLETGWKQPEAMRLYERCGFRRIPCYPPYSDEDESVCYAKDLT